jgi:hypothetical protein
MYILRNIDSELIKWKKDPGRKRPGEAVGYGQTGGCRESPAYSGS